MRKRLTYIVATIIVAVVLWFMVCWPVSDGLNKTYGKADYTKPISKCAKNIYYEHGYYPPLKGKWVEDFESLTGYSSDIRKVKKYDSLYAHFTVKDKVTWAKGIICGCDLSRYWFGGYFGYFYRGRDIPPLVIKVANKRRLPSKGVWEKVVAYLKRGDKKALADLIRLHNFDKERDGLIWKWAVKRAGEKHMQNVESALREVLKKAYMQEIQRKSASKNWDTIGFIINNLVRVHGGGRKWEADMKETEKKKVVQWWLRAGR